MFDAPDDGSDDPRMLKQDDEIFDTARRINCIHFKNIVVEDFLKGLLGIPHVGGKTNLDLVPVCVLETSCSPVKLIVCSMVPQQKFTKLRPALNRVSYITFALLVYPKSA